MYFLHFATPASVPTVVFAAAYPRTGPNGSSHSAAPGHAARGVIYHASAFQLRGLRACLTALLGPVIRSIAGHEAEISGVSGTGLTDLLCGGPFRFEPSCASIQKAFLCLGTKGGANCFVAASGGAGAVLRADIDLFGSAAAVVIIDTVLNVAANAVSCFFHLVHLLSQMKHLHLPGENTR